MEDNKKKIQDEAMKMVSGGIIEFPTDPCPGGGNHEWEKISRYNEDLGIEVYCYQCKKCGVRTNIEID